MKNILIKLIKKFKGLMTFKGTTTAFEAIKEYKKNESSFNDFWSDMYNVKSKEHYRRLSILLDKAEINNRKCIKRKNKQKG